MVNTSLPEGIPQLSYIPDQTIAAGRAASIDFSKFVIKSDTAIYEYSIRDFPAEFVIDSHTGLLTGIAPRPELNETFTVGLVVTNTESNIKTTSFFRLEIIGTILLETPEAKAFFGDEPINFWEAAANYEARQFIQQLLNEHFVWVYFYDRNSRPRSSGEFRQLITAKTGWNIYLFENVVAITTGDKAYAQYGNRSRLLETLREVYQQHLIEKNWNEIGIDGSDDANVGRAWIVGKELEMPVSSTAPTEIAEINFNNMQRIYSLFVPKEPKLAP